jgi:hypothetical protein
LNNPLKLIDPSGNAVECKKGDVNKCLSDIQASVGNKEAASRLYLATKTEKAGFFRCLFGKDTVTLIFIGIKGDAGSFKEPGQNASRLGDLVSDKRVFGYSVSTLPC